MVYALNTFDLVPGEEETYRQYMLQTAPLLADLDAKPVIAARNPLRSLHGETREFLLVMQFGSVADFETMLARQDEKEIGALRERATTNYIWTLYEEWDVGAWLAPSE